MALVLKDRVKETTTTTGTGTITLAGAVSGFQSFSAIGNGNATYYVIADPTTGDWEVGIGTYTSSGTTLSRTTVLSSSNAGSLVAFAAGVKDVFVSYPSSRSVYLDSAGSAVTTLDIGTLGTSTANITTANITAGTITTAPVNNTDIVNKEYADAIASGIHFHEAVDLATTAALPANTYNNGTGGVGATLTANANGALSVDSTLTVVGNRILVKNEVAGANNGVYVVTQVGSGGAPYILTRATDFDSVGTGVDQIDEGDFFLVTSGVANVNTAWVQQTPPPITIGTTAILFQQFSAPITYTAGTGLSESPAYTFNIANVGTAGTYGSASSVPVFTTNAQGQVTGVTPTAIAINGSAVTGNISGSAGSVANALTAGTYLTSGGTYNGSAARTFAVDATDANTASKVVARDASGNFSAGTITATLSGAATSATTATNLAGGAVNRIAVQSGSGTTTFVVAPTASGQVLRWNGSSFDYVAGTISGAALGGNISTLTFGTFLTGGSYNGTGAVTIATNATNANTASTLVARDASGNFSAGTITATLSGNATTASTAGSITSQANSATITATSANTANQIVLRDGSGNFSAGTITATLNGNASTATSATTSGSTSGNAATATALQTARNIGGVSFNGTASIDLPGVNTAGNQNTSGNAATATTATNQSGGTVSATSVTTSGPILRSAAGAGYLNGNYAGVETVNTSGAIYSIGGSYVPGTTNLGSMYGIGYGYSGGTAIGNPGGVPSNVWGMYAASAGTARIFLDSDNGRGYFSGNLYVVGGTQVVYNSGTWGISVTGNAATAGGFTPSQTAGAANRIVVADGSGYINNNYFNSSDNSQNSGVSAVMVKAGDNYLRSGTASAVATFLSGQTMNINGSSTSCSGNAATATQATNATSVNGTATTFGLTSSGQNTSLANKAGPEVTGQGGGGAVWSMHRPGAYGLNMGLDSDNVFRIGGWSAAANLLQITMGGALTMASNVTAYSDERLKKDWAPVQEDFVAKLAKLKSGTYTRIDNEERQAGVGAQSLQPLLPEVVLTSNDGTLSVAYGNAAMVSAVELAKDNVELRARIEKLEAIVAKLIEG
jgi:hypothetical protein